MNYLYSDQNLHPYTFSLLVNLKWMVKRIINPSTLDIKIKKFLNESLCQKRICLNLGCGGWTPYDSIINSKSISTINVDSTIIVNIFHPFTGKKLIVSDSNIYHLLGNKQVKSIVSFHSLPFIHINLPKLLFFCSKNGISFTADISFQQKNPLISPYFTDDQSTLIKALEALNVMVYDVSNEMDYYLIQPNKMDLIGRYLIHLP